MACGGVTPFEFSSSTSSPLYVLVLAGVYRLVGVNKIAPLVLSWGFGLGALWVAAKTLKETVSARWQMVALVGVVLLTPMFVIGTLGMEHSLHLLLVLVFLRCFQDEAKPLWVVAVLSALLVGTRFEGLLMAAAAVLVLLLQRRWVRAGVIAVAAWVPVGIYAWFSMAHGGYWLPNSVAIKGLRVSGLEVGERLRNLWMVVSHNVTYAPHLGLLAVLLVGLAVVVRKRQPELAATVAVVGGGSVLHLLTADVGWAFRYEAYLVGAGLVVLARAWPALVGSRMTVRVAAGCLLLVLAVLLGDRAGQAGVLLPKFSRNIYLQQWQTALFFHEAYAGQAVAANDIGAINYLTDLHFLDLAGLASAEVFQAKRTDDYTTDFLDDLSGRRGVQVAVLYETWFSEHPATTLGGPELPLSWIRVRRWTVQERLQLGDRTVSFYALSPEGAVTLKAKLDAFEKKLPGAVKVTR